MYEQIRQNCKNGLPQVVLIHTWIPTQVFLHHCIMCYMVYSKKLPLAFDRFCFSFCFVSSEVCFPGEGSLQDTTSFGQGNLKQRGAFQALVSWSAPLSPPGWKICQLVIPTTWCLSAFLWKISSMPCLLVCTLFEMNPQKKTSSTWSSTAVSKAPLQTTKW